MAMESINPATGERLLSCTPWQEAQLDQALTLTAHATPGWQALSFAERARLLKNAAAELRGNAPHYARLITLEMGKLLKEARAEVRNAPSAATTTPTTRKHSYKTRSSQVTPARATSPTCRSARCSR